MKKLFKALGLALGVLAPVWAGPSGPPAGNYIVNVSTNPKTQIFNVSSGTVNNLIISGTCTGPGCGSAGGYNIYPASSTALFPFGLSASTVVVTQNMAIGSGLANGQQLKVVNATGGIAINGTSTGGSGTNNGLYGWASGATQNDALFVGNGDISLNGVTGSVGQCLISQGNNNIPTFGSCGAGGGGTSSLGVNFNGIAVTTPTAQINFIGTGVNVVANGSTATVTISGGLPLPSGGTNYWNYPSTATFYDAQGINVSTGTFSSLSNGQVVYPLASGQLTGSSNFTTDGSSVTISTASVKNLFLRTGSSITYASTSATDEMTMNSANGFGLHFNASNGGGPINHYWDLTPTTLTLGQETFGLPAYDSIQFCNIGICLPIYADPTYGSPLPGIYFLQAPNVAGSPLTVVSTGTSVLASGGSTISYGVTAGSMTITSAGGSAGTWIATEGSAPAGTSGAVTVYADSSGPALKAIIGAGTTNFVMLSTGSTAGHIAEFGAVVGTLIDGGVPGSGGGGTPSGSNTNVQFNNAGAFGGSNNFNWYGSSMQVTGNIISSGSLTIQNGNTLYLNSNGDADGVNFHSQPGGNGGNIELLGTQMTINEVPGVGQGGIFIGPSSGLTYGSFSVSGSSANAATTYSGFTSTNNVSLSTLWSLPKKDGTNGQVLTTDGSTHLSFGTSPGIVSPGTFTWTNNFGIQASTLALINATSANTLVISTATNGVLQVSVSSTLASAPSDFEYTASSQTGTIVWGVQYDGHVVSSGTTPNMGTCGTSPSVVGTDGAAVITVGSGVVTSCTMNFANVWANPPVCVESDNSTAVTGDITTTTTSSITFGFSATLGGGTVNVICIGQKG